MAAMQQRCGVAGRRVDAVSLLRRKSTTELVLGVAGLRSTILRTGRAILASAEVARAAEVTLPSLEKWSTSLTSHPRSAACGKSVEVQRQCESLGKARTRNGGPCALDATHEEGGAVYQRYRGKGCGGVFNTAAEVVNEANTPIAQEGRERGYDTVTEAVYDAAAALVKRDRRGRHAQAVAVLGNTVLRMGRASLSSAQVVRSTKVPNSFAPSSQVVDVADNSFSQKIDNRHSYLKRQASKDQDTTIIFAAVGFDDTARCTEGAVLCGEELQSTTLTFAAAVDLDDTARRRASGAMQRRRGEFRSVAEHFPQLLDEANASSMQKDRHATLALGTARLEGMTLPWGRSSPCNDRDVVGHQRRTAGGLREHADKPEREMPGKGRMRCGGAEDASRKLSVGAGGGYGGGSLPSVFVNDGLRPARARPQGELDHTLTLFCGIVERLDREAADVVECRGGVSGIGGGAYFLVLIKDRRIAKLTVSSVTSK
ncbi:hypothetical protein BC567DRAFT_280955 [Phyllosticta citribraziliensis]